VEFENLIENYLLEKQTYVKERPPRSFYVKELTFPCLRSIYCTITGQVEEINVKVLKIMEWGNIFHDWLFNVLAASREFRIVGKEVPVMLTFNGWQVRGRADYLLENVFTHEKVVLEVKSLSPFAQLDKKLSPAPEHVLQAGFYVNALNADKGVILYIIRDDSFNSKFFVFPRDSRVLEFFRERVKLLSIFLRRKKLPPCNFVAWNGRVCNYCPASEDIKRRCFEEKKRLKIAPKEEVIVGL